VQRAMGSAQPLLLMCMVLESYLAADPALLPVANLQKPSLQ
jgi:hypothetical protein